MNRRAFFSVIGGLGAGIVCFGAEPGQSIRVVRRYSYATDSWTACRMYELRAGDVFKLEEVGTFIAHEDPKKGPDGRWGINASFEIDPATNQWVPCKAV